MAAYEGIYQKHPVRMPSNRSFGTVLTCFFTIVALLPLLGKGQIRWWAVAAAGTLLAATLLVPALLAPFNRAWFHFGLLLGRVVNPVVLAIFFYGIVTPFSIVRRRLGGISSRPWRDETVDTYWIRREPPGPEPPSIRKQY